MNQPVERNVSKVLNTAHLIFGSGYKINSKIYWLFASCKLFLADLQQKTSHS